MLSTQEAQRCSNDTSGARRLPAGEMKTAESTRAEDGHQIYVQALHRDLFVLFPLLSAQKTAVLKILQMQMFHIKAAILESFVLLSL